MLQRVLGFPVHTSFVMHLISSKGPFTASFMPVMVYLLFLSCSVNIQHSLLNVECSLNGKNNKYTITGMKDAVKGPLLEFTECSLNVH